MNRQAQSDPARIVTGVTFAQTARPMAGIGTRCGQPSISAQSNSALRVRTPSFANARFT